MKDRILVTDSGIEVQQAGMHGDHTWVLDISWDELSRVIVYATRLPVEQTPWVAMDFDYINGEFATVNQDAAGFADAVAAIAIRGGVDAPDISQLKLNEELEIWQAA